MKTISHDEEKKAPLYLVSISTFEQILMIDVK